MSIEVSRGRLWVAVVFASIGWCLAQVTIPHASAGEQIGEEVVVTLKSGRTVTGTLKASDDREVVLVVGERAITLPRGMVVKVESGKPVDGGTEKAESAGSGGTAPGTGPGRGLPESPPRPSSIEMTDGTKISGYIVHRSEGTYWVVSGSPVAIPSSSVREVVGGILPGGGPAGFDEGGSVQDRARALVARLASKDETTVAAAAAALESLGPEGAKALEGGLTSGDASLRTLCVHILGTLRLESTQASLLQVLLKDEDAQVRATAAGVLGGWYSREVVEGLLRSALLDVSMDVRAQSLRGLARQAEPTEAEALMGLVGWIEASSPAFEPLFEALRRSTGKRLASVGEVWRTWWETEGRDEIRTRIEKAQVTPPDDGGSE